MDDLRSAFAAADEPTRDLTVDLGGLDFIDCAALACLFRVAEQMSRSGRRLVLRGGRGQVARLLDLTGLPTGVERLSDGPRLRLVSGPWAREGSTASREGADVAA